MLKEAIWDLLMTRFGVPAAFRMIRQKNKKHRNQKIRIVFMCQLPQLWLTLQSVYDAAVACEDVETFILAIPTSWENGNVSNEALLYMEENGQQVINAYDEEKETFFDLKSLNPDYVFIPRPYDSYLPNEYRSIEMSKYTKVCYVGYGYLAEGMDMVKVCVNRCFVSNIYMMFVENKTVETYAKKLFPITVPLKIRHIIHTPYPRFDLTKKYDGIHGSGWGRERENCNKRIIWTPRWTLDKKLGASNFFNYKEFMFDYASKHRENDFLFRPHPMMFDNFVKIGAMTKEDVDVYKQTCKDAPNVKLDDDSGHIENFASADILISDLSGVVVDFAITGKPVIYCDTVYPMNDSCKELLDAYYLVSNVEELEKTLDMLCKGEDPKKDIRREIVERVLGKNDGKNGVRMIEYIKNDYYGR